MCSVSNFFKLAPRVLLYLLTPCYLSILPYTANLQLSGMIVTIVVLDWKSKRSFTFEAARYTEFSVEKSSVKCLALLPSLLPPLAAAFLMCSLRLCYHCFNVLSLLACFLLQIGNVFCIVFLFHFSSRCLANQIST